MARKCFELSSVSPFIEDELEPTVIGVREKMLLALGILRRRDVRVDGYSDCGLHHERD
jgi:hypothetical protein